MLKNHPLSRRRLLPRAAFLAGLTFALLPGGFAHAQDTLPDAPPAPPTESDYKRVAPPVVTLPPIAPAPRPLSILRDEESGDEFASDQVIVKFAPSAPVAECLAYVQNMGFKVASHEPVLNVYLLSAPGPLDARTFVKTLSSLPFVSRVEFNNIVYPASMPTDPLYPQQWYLQQINVEQAWDRTIGGHYHVAVLDTGIETSHVDLTNKILRNPDGSYMGYNFTNEGAPGFEDVVGHGTSVASLIAAEGFTTSNVGMVGVSPSAMILPVKVLSNIPNSIYNLAAGIRYAANARASQHDIRVINMSLGYPLNSQGRLAVDDAYSQSSGTVQDAVTYACDKNILVVVAADDHNPDPTNRDYYSFPSRFWNVMSVAATVRATNGTAQRASYSSVGPFMSVAAPGGVLPATVQQANFADQLLAASNASSTAYTAFYGTSAAAPLVSGGALLTLELFPTMQWYDLKNRLEDTAANSNGGAEFDEEIGWGHLDTRPATTPAFTTHYFGAAGTYLITVPGWPASVGSQALDIADSVAARRHDIDRLYPGSNAQVQWFNPRTNAYVNYEDPSLSAPRFGTGRGYFVKFNTAQPTQANTYQAALPFGKPGHPAVIHLYPGWNLVGTPGTTQIPWNTQVMRVRTARNDGNQSRQGEKQEAPFADVDGSWLSSQRYFYNSASNANTAMLASQPMVPGEAYWLRSSIECELLIYQP